jgi:hypothetical protein
MSKLFERTVSSPHDVMAGATGLEPAILIGTGNIWSHWESTEKAGVGGSKSLPGHHVVNELGEILKPSSTANHRVVTIKGPPA